MDWKSMKLNHGVKNACTKTLPNNIAARKSSKENFCASYGQKRKQMSHDLCTCSFHSMMESHNIPGQ